MPPASPLIAVCANQAWNLVNFRQGLIVALRDAGFRVLALAPPDPEMECRLRALGCDFMPVPIDAKGLSPWRDFRTFLVLRKLLGRYRPAAFLGWTIKPNCYGALAAASLGIPALANVSGLGTAFIRTNLLTRLVKGLYSTAFRKAACVFFQNAEDRALFVANGLVRADQARELPGSGIDVEAWKPADWVRPPRAHFLMIARVVADKGVREYVDAAAAVKRCHPHARFTLMGALDVENRTAIARSEVEEWVARGLIDYLPPADDVRGAVAAADFVVLPSYREGLSRVLLEASALGRPLVTSDVPGCREIVLAADNGYLAAPRSASALAQALELAVATDDARWLAMARAGRKLMCSTYSQERVHALYLTALEDAGVRASGQERVDKCLSNPRVLS